MKQVFSYAKDGRVALVSARVKRQAAKLLVAVFRNHGTFCDVLPFELRRFNPENLNVRLLHGREADDAKAKAQSTAPQAPQCIEAGVRPSVRS